MSKNRVGSLYYEIALNAGAFARDTAKIKKESSALTAALRKHQEMMSPEDRLREDRKAQLKVIQRSKMTYDKKRELIKSLFAWEKRELKKLEDAREASRKRDLSKAAAAREKLRQSSFAGGLFGTGQSMQALGKFTGMISQLTMQLFPLMVALYAVKKAVEAVIGVFLKAAEAAAKKKQQILTLSLLLGGNEKRARSLRKELQQYAKDTAFSVEQTMEMATQLKAFGIATDDITTRIAEFGKLAFGDPEKMKRIAKAYTDVAGKGKLMAQELKQFTEAGVPLRAMLMDMTNMTMPQFMKAMEDGAISSDMVTEAMTRLSGLMGDSDKLGLMTSTGQWEALKEEFTKTLEILGEGGLEGMLTAILRILNKGLETFNKWLQIITAIGPVVGDVMIKIGKFFQTIGIVAGRTVRNLGTSIRYIGEEMKATAKETVDAMEKAKKAKQEMDALTAKDAAAADAERKKSILAAAKRAELERRAAKEAAAGNDALQKKLELEKEIADEQKKIQEMFADADMDDPQMRMAKAKALVDAEFAIRFKYKMEEQKKDKEAADKKAKEAKDAFDKERKRKQDLIAEAKKATERQEKAAMEKMKRKLDFYSSAAGGSGPTAGGQSFEAGSAGEYEFMRQMHLQARKDAKEEQLDQQRNSTLTDIYQVLSEKLMNINTGTTNTDTGVTVYEAV